MQLSVNEVGGRGCSQDGGGAGAGRVAVDGGFNVERCAKFGHLFFRD